MLLLEVQENSEKCPVFFRILQSPSVNAPVSVLGSGINRKRILGIASLFGAFQVNTVPSNTPILLMSSWQNYVDDSLVGTGLVRKAMIIGHDGSSWAASAGFSIKPDEAKKLIAAFNDPSSVQGSGISVSGARYLTLKADARSIYGRKGSTGFAAVKTSQAVLLSLYDESIQPGQCTNVTERLADYLIENNY